MDVCESDGNSPKASVNGGRPPDVSLSDGSSGGAGGELNASDILGKLGSDGKSKSGILTVWKLRLLDECAVSCLLTEIPTLESMLDVETRVPSCGRVGFGGLGVAVGMGRSKKGVGSGRAMGSVLMRSSNAVRSVCRGALCSPMGASPSVSLINLSRSRLMSLATVPRSMADPPG